MKRAVIVGKFHPLHRGHSYLIETALDECDEVHVLVCDNEDYTISASLRAKWITKSHPEATVSIIEDIDSDDDSEAWAEHTIKHLGFRPDVAYTSEAYGKPWAKSMGCDHRLVDLDRSRFPVSATAIRHNFMKNWKYLSPDVKKHLAIRIVVVGAESTGTTTLAKTLAQKLACPWTVELGRYYSESISTTQHEWQNEDFKTIARIQADYEDSLTAISKGLVVCDTNAFATKLWQERYMGETTLEVEQLADKAQADLYILTGDEIPFVQDGLRDGEHIRHDMHKRFREELQLLNTPFIEVSGSVQDRVNESLKAIKPIMEKSFELYKNQKVLK